MINNHQRVTFMYGAFPDLAWWPLDVRPDVASAVLAVMPGTVVRAQGSQAQWCSQTRALAVVYHMAYHPGYLTTMASVSGHHGQCSRVKGANGQCMGCTVAMASVWGCTVAMASGRGMHGVNGQWSMDVPCQWSMDVPGYGQY